MTFLQKLWAHRSRIFPLVLVIAMMLVYQYRKQNRPQQSEFVLLLKGSTFGTVPYSIKYLYPEERYFSNEVDSLLNAFNQSLSTYVPASDINRFNREGLLKFSGPWFPQVLAASKGVYEATAGAFDPTVGPLIDAWGFGPTAPIYPDSSTVDSLLQYVGFDHIFFDEESVCREQPGMQLSFSAIAKGQAVDMIAEYLVSQGARHVFVEIGGEVTALGTGPGGRLWRVGVEDPTQDAPSDSVSVILEIQDQGVATSGNYRNFYMKDGRRYAHTLSPQTGYPVEHGLLSATVIAPNCMLADAYATAFMVLGLEESRRIVEQDSTLEAVFIYNDEQGNLATALTDGAAQMRR